MRNLIPLSAVVVVTITLTAQGNSQPAGAPFSANRVLPGCRSFVADNDSRHQYLQGQCAGVVSVIFYRNKTFGFCAPGPATMEQAVRVVIAYADKRPNRLHEPLDALALDALREAWPCARK